MRVLRAGLLLFALACAPALPGPPGAAATSGGPGQPWTPPPHPSAAELPRTNLPPDLGARLSALTLGDVIALALQNSPTTRESWATARAAAAGLGVAQGARWPELDADLSATRTKTIASQGRSAVLQTVYGPSATLSFLLFDFGGRGNAIAAARETLLAADWTHNAAIQGVVLTAETAFFQYLATRALLQAQKTAEEEARTNLAAANERHRIGLATIADVLQAETALGQAELAVVTTEGDLATSRGALAVAMGLPANLDYDVDSLAGTPAVAEVSDSVDRLIAGALADRPDLAAVRAEAEAAAAQVQVARAARLPSLELSGSGGWTGVINRANLQPNYAVTLGLRIPLFAGFSREYAETQASAQADAARARADQLAQQVVFDVFASYAALRTATRRVRSSELLLSSASRSAEVTRGRYREGVGSLLDVLAAESALADARAASVQSRWQWETALAQLAHAAGTLDLSGKTALRLTPDSSAPAPADSQPTGP